MSSSQREAILDESASTVITIDLVATLELQSTLLQHVSLNYHVFVTVRLSFVRLLNQYLLVISVPFYSFYVYKNIKMYLCIMFFHKMSYHHICIRWISIPVVLDSWTMEVQATSGPSGRVGRGRQTTGFYGRRPSVESFGRWTAWMRCLGENTSAWMLS
jgi:hypothetical protein